MPKKGGHRPRRVRRLLTGAAVAALAVVPIVMAVPANAATPANRVTAHHTGDIFRGPNAMNDCIAAGLGMLGGDITGFICPPDPSAGPDALELEIFFPTF